MTTEPPITNTPDNNPATQPMATKRIAGGSIKALSKRSPFGRRGAADDDERVPDERDVPGRIPALGRNLIKDVRLVTEDDRQRERPVRIGQNLRDAIRSAALSFRRRIALPHETAHPGKRNCSSGGKGNSLRYRRGHQRRRLRRRKSSVATLSHHTEAFRLLRNQLTTSSGRRFAGSAPAQPMKAAGKPPSRSWSMPPPRSYRHSER